MLDEVIRELRRPVSASPDLDARIMAEVMKGARRRRGFWVAGALAAGIAALVVLARRNPGNDVAFSLVAPQASSVAVVGDFNDWKPTPLVRDAGGSWGTRLRLSPGQYNYVFVVDGKLVPDPAAPKVHVDDFDSPNSVVTVAL